MAIGPFEVGYPVDFRSGGDTTKQFAEKHIQEIARIYGYLNALNSDKLSTSELSSYFVDIQGELQDHVDDTSPHPNWLINLASQVTGILDPSHLSGTANGLYIPASNVTGLSAYIPTPANTGVTSYSGSENGYVTLNNNLMLQWGKKSFTYQVTTASTSTMINNLSFSTTFPNSCFTVVVSPNNGNTYDTAGLYGTNHFPFGVSIVAWNRSYFAVMATDLQTTSGTNLAGESTSITEYINYIAVGY